MPKFKIGDQIKYNPGHYDVEYGFITKVKESNESAFCRFWSNYQGGQLRTMTNSESCNFRDIKKCNTNIPQVTIDAWLKHLGYNKEEATND
ncbi:hypothetical protein LCGC14_0351810 [marine sediment metagenome]|uniref:Uncharacterized protein n=1 Tax=marine sediment metagenome TaxID=412755 RepID=A0A0F9TTR4_9ZZZZ